MESETCVRLKAVFFLLKEGEEMNINELNNLRYIEKEIKLLQERIEELETEAARVTPILTGLPGKGSGGDRIGAVVEQLRRQPAADYFCSALCFRKKLERGSRLHWRGEYRAKRVHACFPISKKA